MKGAKEMKKLFSISVLVVLSCLAYAQVTAEVPQKINYQGKLTDANGGLIVSDSVDIEFNVYTDSTGGTSLWSETHYDVPVKNGLFSVVLGSQTAIPVSVFDGSIRYLGITVGSDSESTPRTPMVSVGYAYRALHADTAQYAFSDGGDSDWSFADTNIYRLGGNVGIGTNDPGLAKLAVMNGNVGIGTTTPTRRLQVEVEEDSSAAIHAVATGTQTYGISATAGGGYTAGGDAVAVKGMAVGGINGRDNIYGGWFVTQPIMSAKKNYGVWAHGSAVSSDTTYGVYARGSGEFSDATYGLYAIATCTTGTAYAVYGEVPADDTGFAGYFDGEKSYFSGDVGIGTESPDAKLDVVVTSDEAIEATAEGHSGGKTGGEFYASGGGYSNVGVFTRAGCYGLPCTPASHCNIGIYAKDGSGGTMDMLPGGNWAGYFDGDVKVKGDLDLGGEIKTSYDTSWVDIDPGQTKTFNHNLYGDESKYIVFVDGKSSSGRIHQANYGTCYVPLNKWIGCEWFYLTNTQIKVARAADDDDVGSDKDWDEVRVRIFKNQ
jgi:hypothetical protein